MKKPHFNPSAKPIKTIMSLLLKHKGRFALVGANTLITLALVFFTQFTYHEKISETKTVTRTITYHLGSQKTAKSSAEENQYSPGENPAAKAPSFDDSQPIAVTKSVQTNLDASRLISMSVETPSSDRSQTNKTTVICEFSYYEPGDVIPQLDPSFLKLNARSPVARVYNKTAKMNRLQWEMNELPHVPTALMRPKSMNLVCPAWMSQADALKELENSLDESIAPLEKMLVDNPPADKQLASAR